MIFGRTRKAVLAASLAALVGALPAAAQTTLTLGISAAPGTVDPHFNMGTSTQTLIYNIYDTLIERGPSYDLRPGLALSWKPLTDTQWEIKLRPGVRFTNGQPFTADDVAFTFARVPNVPNAVVSYASQLRAIDRVEVVDPLTLHIHTHGPAPTLPIDISVVAIVSRQVGEGATTDDYNQLRAAIGTGPFIIRSYTPGTEAELVRNEAWWGERPDWDRVSFRYISNAGSRSAALLSGGVDLIDQPSPNDLPRFRTTPEVEVFTAPGTRLVYMAPNISSEVAPMITDNDGNPLPGNPLRDLRVRRALSIAINRAGLAERVMQGTAVAAYQFIPPGMYSYNPDIAVPAADANEAKRLLAEAGYPNGFRVTLPVASNSRPTDPVAAQAIAQMWGRIGVQTVVETMPLAAYGQRARRMEFPFTYTGWGSAGQALHPLVNIVASYDRTRLTGSYNRSGYSNAGIDALIARAGGTMDDAAREALLRQAVAESIDDLAIIPLYQLANFWVARRGITYQATAYDHTSAVLARRRR